MILVRYLDRNIFRRMRYYLQFKRTVKEKNRKKNPTIGKMYTGTIDNTHCCDWHGPWKTMAGDDQSHT